MRASSADGHEGVVTLQLVFGEGAWNKKKEKTQKTGNIDHLAALVEEKTKQKKRRTVKRQDLLHNNTMLVSSVGAQTGRLWCQWNLHSITFAFQTVVTCSDILI